MSKKLVLHLAFASMVLGCAPISAIDLPSPERAAGLSIFGAMAVSTLALMHNHPKPDFKQKGEWKGLLKVQNLINTQLRKEYFQNISDVFWTRWVGQIHKSGYLELDKENNAVKPTKKCLPCGVMGQTATYLHELSKAKEMILSLLIVGYCVKNIDEVETFLWETVEKTFEVK
ncbi:hypothetical protein E3J61_03165 [Candidatus Dependentiae bacterium]|nr:MAG: hypothetical protein E3J61_03165 [Candidatus Dependentiae bacterium]